MMRAIGWLGLIPSVTMSAVCVYFHTRPALPIFHEVRSLATPTISILLPSSQSLSAC